MMDFAQWMLPFVTKTDLTKAALKANISHEMQNRFLKLMLDEHSKVGAREQLKKLWTEWVKFITTKSNSHHHAKQSKVLD